MKTKLIILLLLICNSFSFGQDITKYSHCYLGLIVKIQTTNDLFTKYDFKKQKLSGELGNKEKDRKYIDQEYIIKDIIPNVYREHRGFLTKIIYNGSVVVLESTTGGEPLYYYSYYNKLSFGITELYHYECTFYDIPQFDCEQYEIDYYEEQKNAISLQEDMYTGLITLNSGMLQLNMCRDEFVFALKAKQEDTIRYTLTFQLTDSYFQHVNQGCNVYVVFEDNTRLIVKDATVTLRSNLYSSSNPYSYTATIFLSHREFKQFCDKKIKAVKVGSVSEQLTEEYNKKIKYRFCALYESVFE